MFITCNKLPVDPRSLVYFPSRLTGTWNIVYAVLEKFKVPASVRDFDIRKNIARYCRACVQFAHENGQLDISDGSSYVETGLYSIRGKNIVLELERNCRENVQPFCCRHAVEFDRCRQHLRSVQLGMSTNFRLKIANIDGKHILCERRCRFRRPELLNGESLARAARHAVEGNKWTGAIRLGKPGREEPTRAIPMCPIGLGDDDICDAVGLVDNQSLVTILTVSQAYFAALFYGGDMPQWLTKAATRD